MESLARGELDRGFDKSEFCFVKSAEFPFGKRVNPRNALSNPCADLTTRTPRAKDPTKSSTEYAPGAGGTRSVTTSRYSSVEAGQWHGAGLGLTSEDTMACKVVSCLAQKSLALRTTGKDVCHYKSRSFNMSMHWPAIA